MDVFLSWSGTRSQAIASALKTWLPNVIQGLHVWMSSHDIHAGQQWGAELGMALHKCQLGVLCLTPENLGSRWLVFEAGALSTAIEGSRVIPYLFDLSTTDVSPPLSQFQNVVADEEGTLKLLKSINDALKKPLGEEENVRKTFDHWWGDLEEQYGGIQEIQRSEVRSDRDVLDELLELTRQAGIRDLNILLGRLFSSRNVRHVEVALKEVAGVATNRIALRITVEKKRPLAEVPEDERIPPTIFGMPTDVIEGS
jgi:hypothetical protein